MSLLDLALALARKDSKDMDMYKAKKKNKKGKQPVALMSGEEYDEKEEGPESSKREGY